MLRVLRVALVLGACIDGFVAFLGLFAQALIPPLLDIPLKDPVFATFAAGEFAVAAVVYAIAASDPLRYRALLYVAALDQGFAVVLPAYEVWRGGIPASWKTIGPIPLDAVLAIFFLVAAQRLRERAR